MSTVTHRIVLAAAALSRKGHTSYQAENRSQPDGNENLTKAPGKGARGGLHGKSC